jgi:enoyl-CoA hydratase
LSSLVRVEEGTVSELVLTRPEARNALSVELCNAIVDALEEVYRSVALAVIVRGEGKAFCAGADFAAVSGPGGVDFLPAFERMLEAVAHFRLPTIAAIHGVALGGGLQLATACDFRIAADDAKLGIPSTRLGIVVNFENVQRLVLLTGVAIAKEVLMTGRTFSGEDAVARNLVNRTAPAAELTDAARGWAEDIANLAPLSVQGAKRTIQVVADALANARSTSPQDVAAIDELVMQAYNSADLQEGIAAMSEKRDPRFEGR